MVEWLYWKKPRTVPKIREGCGACENPECGSQDAMIWSNMRIQEKILDGI